MYWNCLGPSRRVSAAVAEKARSRLSTWLLANQHSLAFALMTSLGGWEKYARGIREHQGDLDAFVHAHFYIFIDYLRLYLNTSDILYKECYISEKLKQLSDSSLNREQDDKNRRQVTDGDIDILCGRARTEVGPSEAAALESLLREIQAIVTVGGRKELSILLIGDCIYLDVRGFLASLALEDGITFQPTFIASKIPVEQRNALRAMVEKQFDLIFYSPFTYEFALELAGLNNWRRSLARPQHDQQHCRNCDGRRREEPRPIG